MDKRTLFTLILTHQGVMKKDFAKDAGFSAEFLSRYLAGTEQSSRLDSVVNRYISDHIQELGLAVANEVPNYAKAA